MINKKKYEPFLQVCNTRRQVEAIKALMEHVNLSDAAEAIGMKVTNLSRLRRRLKKKLDSAGKGDHFVKDVFLPADILSLKGTTTRVDRDKETGEYVIGQQYVKTDKKKEDQIYAIKEAVNDIISDVIPIEPKNNTKKYIHQDLMNVYITNDLHLGALMWHEETLDEDYDLDIAKNHIDTAIEYLVDNSPKTETAIVADLGDLTEMDDFKNQTPGHGHTLDVDGRYSKVIKVAMQAMVKLIETALTVHKTVHFINISGNHDVTTGHAIRAFVEAWYRNEPRVVVDSSPSPQKYFQFGSTLIGFAHGDGLRMNDAGETMAMHNAESWSGTHHRYYHFGHNHKDKIVDGRLCKAESHRNIAPLNSWASHAGFGRQPGTMKSITYCSEYGEKSRNTFNISMLNK